jgi:hypothetical protein
MPRKTLTDRLIASLKPASRAVYFDTKARGLALRVTPSGTKTWTFVYRSDGKPQWLTLGAYPALTLADARALALDNRHAIDVEKRDPAAEQRAEREAAELPPPELPPVPAVFTSPIWPSSMRSLPAVGRRPGRTTSPRPPSICCPHGAACRSATSRAPMFTSCWILSSPRG